MGELPRNLRVNLRVSGVSLGWETHPPANNSGVFSHMFHINLHQHCVSYNGRQLIFVICFKHRKASQKGKTGAPIESPNRRCGEDDLAHALELLEERRTAP